MLCNWRPAQLCCSMWSRAVGVLEQVSQRRPRVGAGSRSRGRLLKYVVFGCLCRASALALQAEVWVGLSENAGAGDVRLRHQRTVTARRKSADGRQTYGQVDQQADAQTHICSTQA